ncbi:MULTISPECIES: D-glycero-alpha-D-manno-heptose-1,7-bisphosphate 7-phosphatase [Bacillus]|uniref:D-glycero-alpha-D-manno-heptose-1,7-bisphosphate 7-phosphatase n=1 Tax=Bacillus TaxID=1386 RepID=UPI000312E0E4|nr:MULTISPECIES: HAD family hydrolase [Bacillus]
MNKPAVFFDRDGVLNEDLGYVYKREDFIWIPGAIETIKYLKCQGYAIFVVTNQSGIARGYYTENDVKTLHNRINKELLQEHDVFIDAFFYCPHHPTYGGASYQKQCQCRKPRPALLMQAFSEFNIDRKRSVLIGDKDTDIDAAVAAGIKGYKFQSENLFSFVKQIFTQSYSWNNDTD